MIVLAIDTALGACSAALVDGGRTLAARSEPMTRGHQERLAPLVAEVMAQAGVGFDRLDRVAATRGPGSFTGLRVGLAFARTLALARGVPCVGAGTLQALAAETEGVVLAAIPAPQDRLYVQRFEDGRPASEPELAALEAVDLAGVRLIAGPGAGVLRGHAPWIAVDDRASPDPAALARWGARAPEPAEPPAPLYLRPPDARTLAERGLPVPVALPGPLSGPLAKPVAGRPGPDPSRMTVRTAGPGEAAHFAELHAAAFDRPWTADAFRDLLAGPGALALAAGEDGFILLRGVLDEAEVLTLAVRPAARRRGLGGALLDAAAVRLAVGGASELRLEAAADNAAALALYARCGFERTGVRRGYYARGAGVAPADAITMLRRLNSPPP